MKYLLMIVLLFSFNQASAAVFFTGNELYGFCRPDPDKSIGVCNGYVTAFIDTESWEGTSTFCLPKRNFMNQQAIDVVSKYLKDNPEQRHLLAPVLVNMALMEAFPCE